MTAPQLRPAALLTWLTALAFFGVALLLAVVIPIHAQDALTFGEWSRLIAEHWNLHYPAVTAQEYGRPLFYVLQGWVWGAFGFHEALGRVLSGLFALLLFAALVWLLRDRPWGRLAGWSAGLALLASPIFAAHVASGLTDVPVAALVTLTAVIVWGRHPGPVGAVAAALAAGAAMLAKPSALLALVGLGLAGLLPSEPWRLRLVCRVAPVAAGVLAGLVYDTLEAHRAHQSLQAFMQAGVNTAYYRALADESRRYALLDGSWFGDALRLACFFALAYAVLRLARVRHRLCVAAALPLAALLSWLGPWLAADRSQLTVGSLHSVGAATSAAGTVAVLAFGIGPAADAVAPARELARFVVWALPTAVAWAVYGAYDLRLLAPAWPPLLALLALAALPALTALARRGAIALAVAFALLAVLVAENVYNLDGLGRAGWDELRRTNHWLDHDETRQIVLPALSRSLVVVRRELRSDDLLISPEGAFRFYFPGRVEQSFPNSCADLRRFRVFVLLTDEGSKRYMEDFLHVSADPSYWSACRDPRLTQLTDGSEGYAVFRVGT